MAQPVERLWFSTVIEAIFLKGLGDKLTPRLKEEIKKVGIDLNKMSPAYPVEQVYKACKLVMPIVYPGMSE